MDNLLCVVFVKDERKCRESPERVKIELISAQDRPVPESLR